jgi:predicted O-methyltransferase YrrM
MTLKLENMSEETWFAVDAFFEDRLIESDPALDAALRASVAAGLPSIQVSASQGKFLQLLALAQAPRRILEIGTLGGYSTLWLARALAPDGRLVTLEVEPRHAAVARENFARAGVAKQIDLHVGPALETLARFRTQSAAPFDFVFIDADKPNNLNYVQNALGLARPGTLIVVDNVVRGGKVVAAQRDAGADGVRRMADWIAKEPRLRATVIQTVGSKGYDGFLVARVEAPL